MRKAGLILICIAVIATAGLLAQQARSASMMATNVRLGYTLRGNPLQPGTAFYIDFWYQTDGAQVGVVASDLVITYSADLLPLDDETTVLASQATSGTDLFVYDEFATFASVDWDPDAQIITYFGGVDLPAGDMGWGQNGRHVNFARIAFENSMGGGFTVRIAGSIGLHGEVVGRKDWLGDFSTGPDGSVTFPVAGGGDGLP